MLQTELLELTEKDFLDLLETGMLYKLYPALKGVLFNVNQFREFKSQYTVSIEAKRLATEFFYELASTTGADPEELYILLEDNIEILSFIFENSDKFDVAIVFDIIRDKIYG